MVTTDLSTGLWAAAVAALAWGTYMVPLKRQPSWSPLSFMLWSCLGIVVSSILWGLWRDSLWWQPWGIASGALWTVGAVLSFSAVAREGLAAASTRWMGTGILLSMLAGLVFFNERLQWHLGMLGTAGLIGGLVWISHPIGAAAEGAGAPMGAEWPWRSVFAGVVFGLYLIPLKLSGALPMDFVLPMGLGIGLGALFLVVWMRPPNSAKMAPWGIGAGLLWNVANLSSFLAVDSLGYAVGFPLTQMALVVSILWGVLLFREAPTRAHKLRLVVAALFLLGGAALLALGRL